MIDDIEVELTTSPSGHNFINKSTVKQKFHYDEDYPPFSRGHHQQCGCNDDYDEYCANRCPNRFSQRIQRATSPIC